MILCRVYHLLFLLSFLFLFATVPTGCSSDGDGDGADTWVPHGERGTPELIETNDAGDATNVQIVTDGEGNALAVWIQLDGTYLSIWSNRYAFGVGWGNAELIETDNEGRAGNPEIAIDPAGNAMAVWIQGEVLYKSVR